MKLTNKIVGGLLRFKNRQLKDERTKSRALGETNSILSAYVASLIDERGGAKISREKIKNAIGKYVANVHVEGGDYVISISKSGIDAYGKRAEMNDRADTNICNCSTESAQSKESADVRD